MIPGVVREAARRFRDDVALVSSDGEEVTYLDLYHRSEAAAACLYGQGVREGDVVAIALPSGIDYVIAYLAAARIGAKTYRSARATRCTRGRRAA